MTGKDLSNLIEVQLADSPFHCVITRVSDGVIVYANKTAAADIKTEHDIDDPAGLPISDLDYWPSEDARRDAIALARRPGGHVRRDDFEVNGRRMAELSNTHVVELNGEEYVVASFIDVSEFGATEHALQDALQRLERAQSLARIGDFVSDLDFGRFDGSAEAMRILGFDAKAATVTTAELFSRFHPDDKAQVLAAVSDQLPHGAFEVEHRLAPSLGEERWVHTRASVDRGSDGHAIVHGTVQDVTERKREEAERENLNQKLRETQKLESLGLLAGGIAHDFNNLLAGIMGNADFALMDANVPAAVEARLKDIVEVSKRAADLTRQLLAYSGKGRFVIETIDLSELIEEMTDLFAVSISKEHALRLFLGADLPAVEVDTTQIRQVLMNLIINASESIDHKNGMINVTTGRQVCDRAYLDAGGLAELEPGEYTFFEVSDNGAGMDVETMQRIYDPFFTTKFTGRGLGMAAALGIVRGHGGAIKVYSEPGRGTTFKIFLPASDAAAKERAAATSPSQQWQGSGTVLVIDDDHNVRNFAQRVLSRYGYEVLLAKDGVEGLALFDANADHIKVVLLDLTMPNMDGKETYARLRARRPDVATVLMSGYNEQDATQHFVGRGLAGFVAKPFLVKDLMQAIEDAAKA